MRKILAICDLEVAYASHFMEHLNTRRSLPFEVQAFSDLDTLKEAVRNRPIEILLISEKALAGREMEVGEWNIGQVIVLSEGITIQRNESYPTISKYQSSESVIREVMAVYAAQSRDKNGVSIIKREAKVIGIYSPVGRCLKTSFALTMGQLMAKERAVLYLNLESCAGFEELFETVYDRTLSDVIYYMRQKQDNLLHCVGAAVCSLDNLDYIPPVPFPQDIAGVTMSEWQQLLDFLRQESQYEVIILDIGEGVEDVCALLELCDHIFMPAKQDFVSQAKIVQFEKLMELCTRQETISKIIKVKLPYYSVNCTKTQFLRQMLWSEFGDYVRKLIRKEEL